MSRDGRYSRQEVLPAVGPHGQDQLSGAHLAIIGLGGLGCAAAHYLAGAGIGSLTLVDGDRVELSNLQRQTLHRETTLGQAKVASAAAALAALNSTIDIRPLPRRADATLLLTLAAECDALLDCSDNFATRQAINQACVAQRCALVSGAAIRWEGQLFISRPGQGDAPCYACLFGADTSGDDRCEDAGVIGPVVGSIGSAQALEAIKLILGLATIGQFRQFDAMSGSWRQWQVARDSSCGVCGRAATSTTPA